MLARALSRARLSIFWERLWPALASIATAAGLFLAISWLGVWLWLPPVGRAIGLFAFLVLCVAATVPMFLVRVPSANDGLRRLDRASVILRIRCASRRDTEGMGHPDGHGHRLRPGCAGDFGESDSSFPEDFSDGAGHRGRPDRGAGRCDLLHGKKYR
jgi:hypothetical protein